MGINGPELLQMGRDYEPLGCEQDVDCPCE